MIKVAAMTAHVRLKMVHALKPPQSRMPTDNIEPGQMQINSAVKNNPM